jgi:hypothetical protein
MVHLDFTWIPCGFHVELDNNLAGLPAKKFHLESMFPCEFHVDSMWNHLESMGEGKVLQNPSRNLLLESLKIFVFSTPATLFAVPTTTRLPTLDKAPFLYTHKIDIAHTNPTT